MRDARAMLRRRLELDGAPSRHEVPRRIPRRRGGADAGARASRALTTRPWTHHGGLRRPDARHRQVRHRRAAAAARSRWSTGPGCPVCVTPLEMIDKAIEIAARPGVIFCSFGDMLRVPGTATRPARGQGGAAATCASSTRRSTPSTLAREQPRPARSSSSPSASRPPRRPTRWRSTRRAASGLEQLLAARLARARAAGASRRSSSSPELPRAGLPGRRARLHGDGLRASTSRSRARYRVPIVVTGFEPLDILQGVLHVRAAARGGPGRGREPVRRAVRREGNRPAQAADRARCSRSCRPASGAASARSRRAASACGRRTRRSTPSGGSAWPTARADEPAECISGLVLQGLQKPHECPAFGTRCTPEHPLGATMVSSRGRLRGVLPATGDGMSRHGSRAGWTRTVRRSRARPTRSLCHRQLRSACPVPIGRVPARRCWRTAAAGG